MKTPRGNQNKTNSNHNNSNKKKKKTVTIITKEGNKSTVKPAKAIILQQKKKNINKNTKNKSVYVGKKCAPSEQRKAPMKLRWTAPSFNWKLMDTC